MPGFTPHRILAPVNGNPTDEDVVRLACRLALRAHGKVFVITVIEVRRGLALNTVQGEDVDRAEHVLEQAESIAKEYEVEIDGQVLQAREAGPAIVDEIVECRADLAVIGMPFRVRFGEFHMGKTAPFVLRHAPCRTLLLREEPTAH